MLIYRWFCSEIHYSGRSDAQFDTYGKAVEGSGGCLLQQIFTKEEEVSSRLKIKLLRLEFPPLSVRNVKCFQFFRSKKEERKCELNLPLRYVPCSCWGLVASQAYAQDEGGYNVTKSSTLKKVVYGGNNQRMPELQFPYASSGNRAINIDGAGRSPLALVIPSPTRPERRMAARTLTNDEPLAVRPSDNDF